MSREHASNHLGTPAGMPSAGDLGTRQPDGVQRESDFFASGLSWVNFGPPGVRRSPICSGFGFNFPPARLAIRSDSLSLPDPGAQWRTVGAGSASARSALGEIIARRR